MTERQPSGWRFLLSADRSHALRGNASRDAPRPVTRSVTDCIPTQSVGTIAGISPHLRAILSNQFPASPDFGAVLPQAIEESASAAGWHKSCALSQYA